MNDDKEFVDSWLVLGKFNSEFFEKFIVKGFQYSESEREQVIKNATGWHKKAQSKALNRAFDIMIKTGAYPLNPQVFRGYAPVIISVRLPH